MALNNKTQFIASPEDLDLNADCLSLIMMSENDDLLPPLEDDMLVTMLMMLDDVPEAIETGKDRREDYLRGNSLKSLDAEWVDDDIFMDAVPHHQALFKGEQEERVRAILAIESEPLQVQLLQALLSPVPNIQSEPRSPAPNDMFVQFPSSSCAPPPRDSAAFEQYWNTKMAHLAQSMKRTEATRAGLQREAFLQVKQKQRLNQNAQQRCLQEERARNQYMPSSSSNSGTFASFPAAFAVQQGRKLNTPMSSIRPIAL
jgi:hypothetical protein